MRKIIFAVLTSIFTMSLCFSQDIITKKTSEDIQAKVLRVTTTEIIYKYFDDQNGPAFSIPISKVVMVRYQDGTKDIFNGEMNIKTDSIPSSSDYELYMRGQSDASIYYKGYKGAGTATLITSLISPLVGLVPAIACSSTQPQEINLNYPNTNFINNPDYYNGYSQKSKKIKQGKVWTNWGIAFGVNLVAVVLLTAGQ